MNNLIDPNENITVKEASDISGKTYIRIIRAINNKKILATKIKKSYVMKYCDFEKWWKEIQKEDDLKVENINNNKEILEKITEIPKKISRIPYGSIIGNAGTPGCGTGTSKYELPLESDFLDKDFRYICKSFILSPNTNASAELIALIKAIRPCKLTIRVTDIVQNIETFCEILNVSVMGDPQLSNFNGTTDKSMRGTSIFFENEQDVSEWSIFGAHFGQGLIIDVYNPHSTEIKVEILLKGWETKSSFVGTHISKNIYYKFLFSRVECLANKITKVQILAGRQGALKPKYLQINTFNKNITEIIDISVLKKQQIDYLDENNTLNPNHFITLKSINFDIFGESKTKGLDITFKNNTSETIVHYISIIGQPVSEDLVGTR